MEEFVPERVENNLGKRENPGFPAFSPFPNIVFKRFLYHGCIENIVGKGEILSNFTSFHNVSLKLFS